MSGKKYKLGLVLSGGGAKGIAHVGAIKAILDCGFNIDVISGVSAGAIVGSLFADGCSFDEILSFFKQTSLLHGVMPSMPSNGGLVNANKFRKQLESVLKARTFEQLNIPVVINATDLRSGQNVYFSSGDLVRCIMASASVPIFFKPIEIDGHLCVDGGLFSNLPAGVLRNDCDFIIGVHVNPIAPSNMNGGVFEVAERVFHLAVNGNTLKEKENCDLMIEINEVKKFKLFDNAKADLIFKIGYDSAMRTLLSFNFEKYGLNCKLK